jgi:5,5'-dehydrodivanillate O-demethylase oxygenase subunit
MAATVRTRRGNGQSRFTKEDWTDFVHTGPGTLAGQYLRMFWQPVHRSEDLAAGEAKPIKVMSEDFTLYRGQEGAAHVVAFRCAHKGTQLSVGWVEGDTIRCYYHGWVYDGSGHCVEQPAERESFCDKIRIRSYPVEEYLGLIFAYLGEGDPPAMPRYPDQEEEGVHEAGVYIRRCNWFQAFEPEPVHAAFVHRKGRPRPVAQDIAAEQTDWGLVTRAGFPDGSVQVVQLGMPNMHHVMSPPRDGESGWRDNLLWKLPVDDESHYTFQSNLFRITGEAAEQYRARRAQWLAQGGRSEAPELTEAILAGELRVHDLWKDYPTIDVTRVEDDVAYIGQGVIADPSEHRLGSTDVGTILLRQMYAKELRALAEGRPLTNWVRTEKVRPLENRLNLDHPAYGVARSNGS